MRVFFSACLVLFWPLAEFLVLRIYFHDIQKIQIGWGPLLTDMDLLVPVIPAFITYFMCLAEGKRVALRIHYSALAANLLLVAIFVTLNHLQVFRDGNLSYFYRGAWWAIAVLMFASGFFVIAPHPGFFFLSPRRICVLPAGLMALSIILTKNSGTGLWNLVAPITERMSCGLINLVLPAAASCHVAVPNDYLIRITHPMFSL